MTPTETVIVGICACVIAGCVGYLVWSFFKTPYDQEAPKPGVDDEHRWWD